MNLFRSEEHLRRWLVYSHAAGDYVMPVADWAPVFATPMFRRRLEPDYLARSAEYLEDYRRALRATGKILPIPDRILSTIMFTDIVASTEEAARLGDAEWRSLLERHNEVVRSHLEYFDGREIKQTGDGFLSSFPSPAQAIRCAIAICQSMPDLGLQIRAGIHSGECEVLGHDLGGIAVHIGARVAARAKAGEVLVSGTVKDAVVGSDIDFEERGTHSLKGVPGKWSVYRVVH